MDQGQEQNLELKDQLSHILEEARMVLPGIQALFGFQLIAVLNEAFSKKLTSEEQRIHLLSILLTVIAIGVTMAPAALHRISEPAKVSLGLVKRCTSYLSWGLKVLGLAIVTDFFLVSRVILGDRQQAGWLTAVVFLFLLTVWVILPRYRKQHYRAERERESRSAQMEPRSSNT